MRDRGQLIEGPVLSELTNKQNMLLAEIVKLSKVAVLKSEKKPSPTERWIGKFGPKGRVALSTSARFMQDHTAKEP